MASMEGLEKQLYDAQSMLMQARQENQSLTIEIERTSELVDNLENEKTEVEASCAQQLQEEVVLKDEAQRELAIVQGILDATVASRDCALEQADSHVGDLKGENDHLKQELVRVKESASTRMRALETSVRERDKTIQTLKGEKDQREKNWQTEKDKTEALKDEKNNLLCRIHALEEDWSGLGNTQARLTEVREEARSAHAEFDIERAQFEECRQNLEAQLMSEREFSMRV